MPQRASLSACLGAIAAHRKPIRAEQVTVGTTIASMGAPDPHLGQDGKIDMRLRNMRHTGRSGSG